MGLKIFSAESLFFRSIGQLTTSAEAEHLVLSFRNPWLNCLSVKKLAGSIF